MSAISTAVLAVQVARAVAGDPEAEASNVPAASEAPADKDDTTDGEEYVRSVVVTGTRTARSQANSPIATQVHQREEIEESGAENLAELLEETPGVVVQRGIGGSGIQMQGLDPSYTVILVDGQRANGRINNVLDLSRFPAEDIERVEIVRGPSAVLYGSDALAGTVNLISRRPKKPFEAEVHNAYGSFDTLDLTGRVGGRRSWYAGTLSAGLHRTAGWDADRSDRTTTGPQQQQYNVASTQDFGSFGPFNLQLRGSYLRRDAVAISETSTGAVLDVSNRTEVLSVSARPSLESGPAKLTFTGSYSLFRDQFLQDQRGGTQLDQSQDTFDHLAQTTLQYDHQVLRHVVTAGVDGQFEALQTPRIDPGSVDRQRYALFLQDEWTPVDDPRVVVFPGVRLDYDTYFGVYPTPRLAIMVRPTRAWTFRASYGRGFRAPSFRELFLLFANPSVGYTVRGNPSLRPETSWSASFSAEYRPIRWVTLGANVFDNRLSDTITFDTIDASDVDTASLFQYVNIGEATTRGAESTASFALGRVVALDGSYTFTDTFDHEAKRALPGRSRHRGTAGVRFHRRRWGTTLRVRSAINGRRVFFADNDGDDIEEEVPADPFATLDARLSQRFLQYMNVFVGVENILDAGDATVTPISPRTYYGGVTVRY